MQGSILYCDNKDLVSVSAESQESAFMFDHHIWIVICVDVEVYCSVSLLNKRCAERAYEHP